jgi:hexosaminidase
LGATRFLRRLDGRTGLFLEQGFVTNTNEFPSAELQINRQRSAVLGLNEDENYVGGGAKYMINATNDLGALHALETLLQLLQNSSTDFYFPTAVISDKPRFAWRGLMIDAADTSASRCHQRNLDAMAAVKMNVFIGIWSMIRVEN